MLTKHIRSLGNILIKIKNLTQLSVTQAHNSRFHHIQVPDSTGGEKQESWGGHLAQQVRHHLEYQHPLIKMPWFTSELCFQVQLPINAHSQRQQVITKILRPCQFMSKIQSEFLDPGFSHCNYMGNESVRGNCLTMTSFNLKNSKYYNLVLSIVVLSKA